MTLKAYPWSFKGQTKGNNKTPKYNASWKSVLFVKKDVLQATGMKLVINHDIIERSKKFRQKEGTYVRLWKKFLHDKLVVNFLPCLYSLIVRFEFFKLFNLEEKEWNFLQTQTTLPIGFRPSNYCIALQVQRHAICFKHSIKCFAFLFSLYQLSTGLILQSGGFLRSGA